MGEVVVEVVMMIVVDMVEVVMAMAVVIMMVMEVGMVMMIVVVMVVDMIEAIDSFTIIEEQVKFIHLITYINHMSFYMNLMIDWIFSPVFCSLWMYSNLLLCGRWSLSSVLVI